MIYWEVMILIVHLKHLPKFYFILILKFSRKKNNRLKIATARAGNVVGGGDWSKNRLIPDCMKSWLSNRRVI